jgi:hypothetical protein
MLSRAPFYFNWDEFESPTLTDVGLFPGYFLAKPKLENVRCQLYIFAVRRKEK